jgi:tetratricopeptide (TPR) repeat protein
MPPALLRAPSARLRLLVLLTLLPLLGLVALSGCRSSREAQLEEIRALQDAGLYAETIEPLRELLAESPDQPEANYRLGTALLRTGQASLALWPLHKAAATEEYGVSAGLALASTLLGQNQREEALKAANAVLEIESGNEGALVIRARAALAGADPEQALADAERLLEISPDRYLGLRAAALAELGRLDEAEQAYAELVSAAEQLDLQSASQACFSLASFYAGKREDAERAAEQIERCLEPNPADPAAVRLAVQLYDRMELPEQATATLQRAVEAEPSELQLRKSLANRLLAEGKTEEAEEQLREAAEALETPEAWYALANLRRNAEEPELALVAMERALELAPGNPEELTFALADLLAEVGRLEEAERIAAELTEPAYRNIARGRILLERGESAEALAALGSGIQAWPNNAGARLLAAEAALDLGDTERAMIELREATRLGKEDNNAALLLGRLYLARGDFESANALLRRHVGAQGFTGPEAHLLLASAEAQRGRYDEARGWLEELRKYEAYEGLALAELARVELRASGAQAAIQILEESDLDLTDPRHESAARQWIGLLLASGEVERARAWAERVAESDSASLQALRGDLLVELGEEAEARAVFEAALEADPESGPALAGLGQLEQRAGSPEEALALFERALAAHPGDSNYAYFAVSAQLALGREEEGASGLRALLRRNPEHVAACNDLAWLLAEQGEDLDLAAALATRAARIDPRPEVLDTLGWVRLRRGEVDPAIAVFEKALAEQPELSTARYHLGLALVQRGDEEAARQAFRAALDAGPFPESEAARRELERLGPQEATSQ